MPRHYNTKPRKPVKKAGTKGAKSKTMPGRLDFTTKRTSKFFVRGGKRFSTALGSTQIRNPYQPFLWQLPASAKRRTNRMG
jgi:hypothetical protein